MKPPVRIIHFVTGGGSGATKIALDLACAHRQGEGFEPLLVLRRKKAPLPAPMQAQIAAAGLQTAWVDNWPKWTTRRQLAVLIAAFQPQVFAAHGFSEHLWGRQAALAAGVAAVVHIEHNRERYRCWHRWMARRLTARTAATVCVSRGVAEYVRHLGLAGQRLEVILNGVDVARLAEGAPPYADRGPDLIMPARFARQKDQPTLIRAARRLVDTGWSGRLWLCGGGKALHRRASERLVERLGLGDRVEFPGSVADLRPLLHRSRAMVLATHYEGLPLALVEAMAAGCAAIGSRVSGVTDIIAHGSNGWLFPDGDDATLAEILRSVLAGGPAIEAVVAAGRAEAPARFSLGEMVRRYEALFAELLAAPASAARPLGPGSLVST